MGNFGAVFVFEWKRSLTAPRMAWWAVLAGFPIFIIGLIRISIDHATLIHPDVKLEPPPRELWIGFLFALVPMLVSMLGTLLWATPAISIELERRSWVYLSVRPHGPAAVLLGKYLAAVTWVIPPALAGMTVAVYITGVEDMGRVWWAMTKLVCLSTPAFAAVYLLIGTVMPQRAMVLAVAYSLIFELIVSFVPAVINKLTVHHRLQALVLQWCEMKFPPSFRSGASALFENVPPSQHVTILLLYPPVLVGIAIAVLRQSEFSAAAESDV